jgi:hypothetical protein
MSVLVYAISRDDARAPAATELQEICAAGLRALAEPVQEPLTADLEQLVRYEETVETVMARHTILPMRFGSVVDGEAGVRELLKARAREFAKALARLDGCVEFGVQASAPSLPAPGGGPAPADGPAPPANGPASGPGESYMQARLVERRCRRELQDWLDTALDGVVRERVYRATPVCGPDSIRAAYLIDRSEQDSFLRLLAELSRAEDRTLSWSGPWPPYTFVEGLEG